MSSLTSRTLSSVSTGPPSCHPAQRSSAPIPNQQKKQKATEREKTQAEMDEIISEWFKAANKTIDDLAVRFNKKPRFFQDIFFGGGAHMVHHHNKVNAHSTFLHFKSQELRDGMYLTVFTSTRS